MELVIILALISCILGLPVVEEKRLYDDYLDFKIIATENADEIGNIFSQYLNDEKFLSEIIGFMSPEVGNLIEEIDKIPEFQELVKYLYDEKFTQIYQILEDLHAAPDITIPEYIHEHAFCKLVKEVDEHGIRGFLNQIKPLVNENALQKLYNKKLRNSKPFQELIQKLQSEPIKANLVAKVRLDPNYLMLKAHAIELGIDGDAVQELLHQLFGW